MSKKNRRIVLIVVLAAFVSILGGVSLYSYLTPQKTTVYVFKDNYESGTTVTKSMTPRLLLLEKTLILLLNLLPEKI